VDSEVHGGLVEKGGSSFRALIFLFLIFLSLISLAGSGAASSCLCCFHPGMKGGVCGMFSP